MEQIADKAVLEKILTEYTIRRNSFVVLFIVHGILCIIGLTLVSQVFTKNLVSHIMKPLNILSDGAERIKKNDFWNRSAWNAVDEGKK